MKNNLLLKCGWLTIVCLLCSMNIFAQKPVRNLVKTNGYTSNGTATIPADAAPVVKAEAWGAGGAGGHAQLSSGIWVAVAGGGGGAYAGDLVPLTNERVFTLTVGKGGTNSNGTAVHGGNSLVEYNGTTVVEAGGGKSVTGTNNKTGAEGGKAIKGGNNRKWNGGNGGRRSIMGEGWLLTGVGLLVEPHRRTCRFAEVDVTSYVGDEDFIHGKCLGGQ